MGFPSEILLDHEHGQILTLASLLVRVFYPDIQVAYLEGNRRLASCRKTIVQSGHAQPIPRLREYAAPRGNEARLRQPPALCLDSTWPWPWRRGTYRSNCAVPLHASRYVHTLPPACRHLPATILNPGGAPAVDASGCQEQTRPHVEAPSPYLRPFGDGRWICGGNLGRDIRIVLPVSHWMACTVYRLLILS